MFLHTVIEIVYQFLFPKLTEECNGLLPDGAADSAPVTQQGVCENCPQMIDKEQWPRNNSPNLNTMELRSWGATHEAILKRSSEAQNSFWINSRTGEDIGQFSACPINKGFRNNKSS